MKKETLTRFQEWLFFTFSLILFSIQYSQLSLGCGINCITTILIGNAFIIRHYPEFKGSSKYRTMICKPYENCPTIGVIAILLGVIL